MAHYQVVLVRFRAALVLTKSPLVQKEASPDIAVWIIRRVMAGDVFLGAPEKIAPTCGVSFSLNVLIWQVLVVAC